MKSSSLLIIALLFTYNACLSQNKRADSCFCGFSLPAAFSRKKAQSIVPGKVVVAILVDSIGILGNPAIFKGLAGNDNEEALLMVRSVIIQLNNCYRRCRYGKPQPKSTIYQTITFAKYDDEAEDD